ncbi:carbohydrate-binding family 9-like protein [Paenibacillus lignilyticus]|uniref:Carbohydrate-binding family 9-like protein n=1 Tax=Paenibacillus lignilyticus TaxID=1172615 RepID=A0ABS5CGL5_9BACL|nr:carbohydrate-binding family 9-like protein [Paenibacillus lignilyticus]MBP3964988.1 carbohydrate-binding family 9-like protein [Paenibacillus lignilyticus]
MEDSRGAEVGRNMDANERQVYECKQISETNVIDSEWMLLRDTVSGDAPTEWTKVRCGWTADALLIQFLCEDEHIVSDYSERDEPLYNQDVVEVFIDEDGRGTHYIELEVSPRNVVFDARITNDGSGSVGIDTDWDIEGLHTEVSEVQAGQWRYDIRIPASTFKQPLEAGLRWRVNFYRIDERRGGIREYQAWQPTGLVNFHQPQRFGTLVLI